jgi:outer membrane protein OmpA-like peptidoglycan-associated protein/uncharacterized protein YegP (UPF0339 family)
MNDKWEFYKDADTKWRWRRTAPNGNIVGASTEGYANKVDCEANAQRNGWKSNPLFQEGGDTMTQNDLNEEDKEIRIKAYALFKERGFKDGNDFVDWLEAERKAGIKSRSKRDRQMKNVLSSIAAILCVIVIILTIMLFKKNPQVELAKQNSPEPKIMMFVIDPKPDEKMAIFGDTHFDYDKFTLTQEAKTLLDKDVQVLKENPKMHVRMAGYTSGEGTEEINQKLSEQRANTVRDYLIEKGIAPEKITIIGYGRTKPAVYEVNPENIDTKEAKANMRVLFEVIVQ